MTPLSVNEALEKLDELAGTRIRVRGLLSFGFEDVSLNHLPAAERAAGYASSIWLSEGPGAPALDEEGWRKLNGKIVLVEGILHAPEPTFGGCGHMSLWSAALVVRTLERAPKA